MDVGLTNSSRNLVRRYRFDLHEADPRPVPFVSTDEQYVPETLTLTFLTFYRNNARQRFSGSGVRVDLYGTRRYLASHRAVHEAFYHTDDWPDWVHEIVEKYRDHHDPTEGAEPERSSDHVLLSDRYIEHYSDDGGRKAFRQERYGEWWLDRYGEEDR